MKRHFSPNRPFHPEGAERLTDHVFPRSRLNIHRVSVLKKNLNNRQVHSSDEWSGIGFGSRRVSWKRVAPVVNEILLYRPTEFGVTRLNDSGRCKVVTFAVLIRNPDLSLDNVVIQ